MRIAMTACALALSCAGANAQEAMCTASSGAGTNVLVELFTSEGCDSCPPAERWLNDLSKRAKGQVIPLALHVDYWDHLGWKDPWARAAYAARQREQVKLSGGKVVYTPQVMVNGRDYRQWNDLPGFERSAKVIGDRPARATLNVQWKPGGQGTMEVSTTVNWREPADAADAVLYVAVYEDGLASSVRAGENRGKQLRHDRVVREWLGPVAPDAQSRIDVRRAVMLPVRTKTSGVVALVQNRRTGEILQAVDSPACG